MPKLEINGLWKALLWASVIIPTQRIVLKGDIQSILSSFLRVTSGGVIHSFDISDFWFYHLHMF